MDSRAQRGLVRVEPCPKRIRAYFGMACFYNEKVDLFLDGELQARPDRRGG